MPQPLPASARNRHAEITQVDRRIVGLKDIRFDETAMSYR
jgi:hypothetical protein